MATKIRHIAFMVEEPPKLFDFYNHLFGVEQVRLSPTGSVHVIDGLFNLAFLQITGGEVEIANTHRADGTEADQTQGINHFGFVVDKLDDVLPKLPPDLQFGESPQNGRPAEMRVIDPWGNRFDLSSRGFLGREEKNLPGVRFMAVHNENPEEAATFYKEIMGLEEVSRDGNGILLSDGDVSMRLTTEQIRPKSGIQYLGFQVTDWADTQQRCREVGIDLPPLSETNGEVRLTDPEGNLFLVSKRGWEE
jgi:catechol 2,3-dioxygenase-like lactoylglutathione lyase family enzyme